MKIEKILVTGAAGMVGSYIERVFHGYDLVLSDIRDGFLKLDIRDPKIVVEIFEREKPSIVLHLAAETDVDFCEREPDNAYHTNALGTQNVALACQKIDCPVVYISTAGVFWGDNPEPYTEFDNPLPKNVYGRSKLKGEEVLMSLCRRYYVVRAGWMIGGGAKDKKFVGFMTRKILNGETELKMVNDKFGSPTYAKDLLEGIRWLIHTGYYGLYHMVNSGSVSRCDVGKEILRILKKTDVSVIPVSSAFFPLSAPRARSEVMRNLKLDMLGHPPMRTWQEALKEYLTKELLPELQKR
jgi:dTDP-4-dehydrorhamnose reductase